MPWLAKVASENTSPKLILHTSSSLTSTGAWLLSAVLISIIVCITSRSGKGERGARSMCKKQSQDSFLLKSVAIVIFTIGDVVCIFSARFFKFSSKIVVPTCQQCQQVPTASNKCQHI